MTTLTITLPDELAAEFEAAGLTAPDSLKAVLRDYLRKEQSRRAASWLPEALRELENIDEDIKADDLPQVADNARSEARRTLRALSNQQIAPIVYPTEDAEVSVYFKAPGIPYAVQVLLESGGGATWSSIVPGYNANGRCEDSSQLPMGLLPESLQALSEIPARG